MGKPKESSETCPHPCPILPLSSSSSLQGSDFPEPSKTSFQNPEDTHESLRAAAVQLRHVLICNKDFKASLCFLAHLFWTSLREKQLELVSRAEIIILDCICSEEDDGDSLIHL